MLKKVVLDYMDSLRWSRIKNAHNFSTAWFYIYMLTIFPMLLSINETLTKLGAYYLGIVPLLFGTLSVSVVHLRLPKQMFLCPLTQSERKQYVWQLFGIRLFVPLLFGIVSSVLIAGLKMERTEQMILYVFGFFSFLFCTSITSWPGSVWNRMENGAKRLKNPKFKGLRVISAIGMIMGMVLVFGVFFEDIGGYSIGVRIFIGIYCFVLLIFDLLMIRYIDPVLESGINYEDTYEIMQTAGK